MYMMQKEKKPRDYRNKRQELKKLVAGFSQVKFALKETREFQKNLSGLYTCDQKKQEV